MIPKKIDSKNRMKWYNEEAGMEGPDHLLWLRKLLKQKSQVWSRHENCKCCHFAIIYSKAQIHT